MLRLSMESCAIVRYPSPGPSPNGIPRPPGRVQMRHFVLRTELHNRMVRFRTQAVSTQYAVQFGVARDCLRAPESAKSFGPVFKFSRERARSKRFCGAARQAQPFGPSPNPALPIGSVVTRTFFYTSIEMVTFPPSPFSTIS